MYPGTQGYSTNLPALIARYEELTFEAKHAPMLHLLPSSPVEVLDIGTATGSDASWFATHGHRVLAVEPTDGLREAGMRLHPSENISWLKDGLPLLRETHALHRTFDLILLSAVWMHLDVEERAIAMPHVASLLRPNGLLLLTLRHGPVPQGRRMFPVSPEETILLASAQGLSVCHQEHRDSVQEENRLAGVTWSHLAFRRA